MFPEVNSGGDRLYLKICFAPWQFTNLLLPARLELQLKPTPISIMGFVLPREQMEPVLGWCGERSWMGNTVTAEGFESTSSAGVMLPRWSCIWKKRGTSCEDGEREASQRKEKKHPYKQEQSSVTHISVAISNPHKTPHQIFAAEC